MNKNERLSQDILNRVKVANSVDELTAIWPEVEKLPVAMPRVWVGLALELRHIQIRLDALEKAVFNK